MTADGRPRVDLLPDPFARPTAEQEDLWGVRHTSRYEPITAAVAGGSLAIPVIIGDDPTGVGIVRIGGETDLKAGKALAWMSGGSAQAFVRGDTTPALVLGVSGSDWLSI